MIEGRTRTQSVRVTTSRVGHFYLRQEHFSIGTQNNRVFVGQLIEEHIDVIAVSTTK